ncbi:MAG: hypothetical protein M3O46_23015 [Myxococcota bacterium]|nr:hypothetical protein [Myxococcota bacterium]
MRSLFDGPGAPRRRKAKLLALKIAAAGGTLAWFAACQAFGVHSGGEGTPPGTTNESAPGLPCLGTCVPDPGSVRADCSESTRIEKLTILTFDDVDTTTGNYIAQNMYGYTDATAMALTVYGNSPSFAFLPVGYQPPTARTDLCRSGNFSLHVVGGYLPRLDTDAACNTPLTTFEPTAFRGYGGGLGISMQKLNNSDGQGDTQKGLCGAQPGGGASPHPEVCPPSTAEYAVRVGALDVSTYEGVSFWARRGPNSQAGIGVNVGDKYTDDDLSYLTHRDDPTAPRHCERIKQCGCSNLKPCAYRDPGPDPACYPNAGFYCLPIDRGLAFQSLNGQGSNVVCDVTECNQPYPAYPNDIVRLLDGGTLTGANGATLPGDAQFFGRPCTPYAWPDGTGNSYCFDPSTDPVPPTSAQTCGDHWMKMVDLTTDWHFYKVPFTDLRQQGWAKKSEQLDLHSVSVVRFTWTNGWIDYWIDEVSFYHNMQ